MDTLTVTEKQALAFLAMGPHTMPRTLETEEQMCAVLVFGGLKSAGLVMQSIGDNELTYRLTRKGVEAAAPLPSLHDLLPEDAA